jgi:hypothetical protein
MHFPSADTRFITLRVRHLNSSIRGAAAPLTGEALAVDGGFTSVWP